MFDIPLHLCNVQCQVMQKLQSQKLQNEKRDQVWSICTEQGCEFSICGNLMRYKCLNAGISITVKQLTCYRRSKDHGKCQIG
jgi:hypothetical protein